MVELNPLKDAVKASLYTVGAYHARRAWAKLTRPGPRVVILVYHNLTPDALYQTEPHRHFVLRPEITVQMFRQHMEGLRSAYPVLPLAQALTQLREETLDADTVVVTFDDGYRSFLELAFPVLKSLSLPATVFLATDFVGQERFFWWDELNQLVYRLWTSRVSLEGASATLGSPEHTGPLPESVSGARRFLDQVEGTLRYASSDRHDEVMKTLRAILPASAQTGMRPEPILTWDEIRTLSHQGITFGSHTCSHFAFGHVGRDQMVRELRDSKAAIERAIDHTVDSFAFPYGGDGESYRRARDILEQFDYRYARTTLPGFNDREANPFLLRSGSISAHSSRVLIRRDLALGFVR